MTIVYADNYRGFENEIILIKDTNFFVGENSTGKTSMLSLIRLMFSPRFWYVGLSNTEEMNFGLFKDVANSAISKFFKIGLLGDSFEKEADKYSCSGFILKYEDKKGLPELNSLCYIDNGQVIKVILNGKRPKYTYKKIEVLDVDDEQKKASHLLQQVTVFMDEPTIKNYHYIHNDQDFNDPLFILNYVLMDIKMRENSRSNKSSQPMNFKLPSSLFDVKHIGSTEWIAPIRAKPKKTYDEYGVKSTPEGDHAPYILRTILSHKKNKKIASKKELMDKFGAESGLFDLVDIKTYGKELGSPFELDIQMGDAKYPIPNVGYGVAQVLPILTGSIFNEKDSCVIIQQPEVHLHPRAQAALGDLFYKLVANDNMNFLIETHSDFLIDRFRLNLHLNEDKNNQNIESHVLFFTRENSRNRVCSIKIEQNGKYAENQPDSFRDFFIKEDLTLLEI